jgi:hypothetical protein
MNVPSYTIFKLGIFKTRGILCQNENVAFSFPCTVSELYQPIFRVELKQGCFRNQHEQSSLDKSRYIIVGGSDVEKLTMFYAKDFFAVSPVSIQIIG